MKLRKILQITAGVVLLGIIVGYSIYQAQDFWAGPAVTIEQPRNGWETTQPLIEISGSAERIAYLSLNGRQIFVDQSGHFEEELLLTDGYNIITVAANDEFGRSTEANVRVILHASSSLLFSNQYGQETEREEENQGTEE